MFTIIGEVRDTGTNQPLAGVIISLKGTQRETYTDRKGKYKITSLAPGDYALQAQKTGYRKIQVDIPIPEYSGKKILIGLRPSAEPQADRSGDAEVEKEAKALARKIFTSIPDSLHLEKLWRKGNQLLESTDPEFALELWEQAYQQFSESKTQNTDPRIGIRYIEYATEQKLYGRYKTASEIYNWSLSNVIDSKFAEDLSLEIRRLEPITPDDNRKRWQKLLKEGRLTELGQLIKSFWILRDPTLNTDFNERLIEHWERLAYVRDRFRRNSSWVYGTDDRARIYVRFGKPDVSGQLAPQSGEAQQESDQMIAGSNPEAASQAQSAAAQSASGSQTSGTSGSSGSGSGGSGDLKEISSSIREEGQALQQLVKQLNTYADLDVWIYRKSNLGTRKDVILLFGNDGNTGEYRQLKAVEDLIPSTAFRPDPFTSMIPPSLPMQMAYYSNLGNYHPLFDRIYFNLSNLRETRNVPPRVLTRMMRSRNQATFNQLLAQAPEDHSVYASRLSEVPLEIHQYRLLDDDNRPVLATFAESRPPKGLFYDQIKEKSYSASYNLHFGARIFDSNGKVIYENFESELVDEDFGDTEKMKPAYAYFSVPNLSDETSQVFSVELRNPERSSELSEELFPENIRGLGRTTEQQSAPLTTDLGQLEVSDLIIGYNNQIPGSPFGFQLAPEKEIPEGEHLMIHFEVYHLNIPAGQPGHFKVDYLLQSEEGFLQRLFGSEDRVGLTLNYETNQSVSRNNLEIDTSELKPGEYDLEFTVTEPSTGRQKTRQTTITIIE